MMDCEWWSASSRFSRRASAPGFHHTASLPGRSATTAWPEPTDRAPTGRRRNSAPSSSAPFCADARGAAEARSASAAAERATALQRRRLIDEHDGDVVADGVAQTTRGAHERLLVLAVLELALALRAHQDGQ